MDGKAEKNQNKSIRPGFLGGKGGGETPIGLNTENPGLGREEAAKSLNSAEKAAEGGLYNRGDNLDGAREAEGAGFYSGGKMLNTAAKVATKGKFKGSLKKGGPLVGIIFVIFLVGGVMGGTQFFQPFSLIAQFQETFNSMQVSANARSSRWMRWQLGDHVKDPVKGSKVFGNEHFKISDKQADELKKQGIEYDKDANKLRYTKANGTEVELGASAFRETYNTDAEFFHKYNAGSMTWRGQFANWFGTNTTSFLKNNKITRNLFNDYKEKRKAAGGDGLKVVKEKLRNRTKSVAYGGTRVVDEDSETVTTVDEDGNESSHEEPILRTDPSDAETIDRTSLSEAEIRSKISGIAGRFGGAANVTCALMGAAGAINLLIAANEALQIINATSAYFEAVNKTQAGYGDESPINELADTLNLKKHNEGEVVNEAGDGQDHYESDKTAMQAEGVAALYTGGKVNPKNPSVQSVNPMSSMSRIMGGLGVSVQQFEACAIAKAGAAAITALIDVASISLCIFGMLGAYFTLGISAGFLCEPLIASLGTQLAAGIAISVALDTLVSVITPVAVSIMTRDLVGDDLGGEILGNMLTSGGNMYLGGAHRGNGGSLSTEGKYEEYAVAHQQVIAEQAREERLALSPFDISSKNTFMGSIMTQLMSFNTASSPMSTVTTGGAVVSSSLVGLSAPAATAYDIAATLPNMDENADDYYGKTCPYLASIGAVGDAYCNPYIMTDIGTMDYDPGTVIDEVDARGGLGADSGDNVTINKDSDLAKYIVFCDNRASAFGVADYDIASVVGNFGMVTTGNSLADSVVNGAIGSVPVIGDIVEIIDDTDQLDNIGYISGESCVAGNNVDAAQSPNWETAKYYQRFIEDQSLAESSGLIEKSAVTAFLEEYYEENPLDNSYEGMLARYSGLDKQTVTDLLDVIAYYDYINNYDASERYAFDGAEAQVERVVLFDEENILDGDVVMLENIVYADVRNRTFVV